MRSRFMVPGLNRSGTSYSGKGELRISPQTREDQDGAPANSDPANDRRNWDGFLLLFGCLNRTEIHDLLLGSKRKALVNQADHTQNHQHYTDYKSYSHCQGHSWTRR